LMTAARILALFALLLALKQTGISQFFGITQLKDTDKAKKNHLVTDGFYCHLRNPLFYFGALFLWLSPIMTASLLAFNILATIYFYVGARHEERSLRQEFGNEYDEYRRSVPMFIPRMRC
ncbi:MAG: isoprenylcysteine carboxylmethyltransferase family protein, partial [Methanotrichaceae archaeon]|nr:isoprenylcysteine carboxylmethyltransferase family protein [Methanotrichaceae archaeon]